MQVWVNPQGKVSLLYDERLTLVTVGRATIRRASHAESTPDGKWCADLRLINGPLLGPFSLRSEAITAEVAWIERHALPRI